VGDDVDEVDVQEGTERPLPPSEQRLSLPITALDLGGDAVFVTDADGVIVDVNDAFVRMTGYARHEAIGETPRLLSSGYQDESYYDEMWATITGGDVWEGELIDRRRDGQLRTHHVTITPVRDGSGTITNYVAVERDITSDLARTGGTKRSGLVHTDGHGGCIYADADAGMMFGRDPAALLGHGLRHVLTDEDADAVEEAVGMAVETGRDHHLDVRSATDRWLRMEVSPLTLSSGAVIGARCTIEDVTEQILVEHELARRGALVNSVLDALEEPVAVVGVDGDVLTVNLAWRQRSAAGEGLLAMLQPGSDARRTAAAAEDAGDPHAAVLAGDLDDVLTGRRPERRRDTGFSVHPLAWDEGGAILRYRGAG
jgi:PAS domain S-box-containing protein